MGAGELSISLANTDACGGADATWVKVAIDAWTSASGVAGGHVFRPVNRGGRVTGERLGEKVVWQCSKSTQRRLVFQASRLTTCGAMPHAA
jgi:hypothetical protein